MAGIALTPKQRSELLKKLLETPVSSSRPQTGIETGLKLMGEFLRQKEIGKLQEQEAQTTKVRGANEAAALAEALGEQPKSVFGTELPGQQAPGSMRQHLMTQNPESAYGPALTQFAMRQQLESQKAANKPPNYGTTTVWDGKERVQVQTLNGKPIPDSSSKSGFVELGRGEVSGGVNVNVNPNNPFESKGARDQETRRIRATKNLVGELGESLRNVRANPRATGMIGAGADAANAFADLPGVGPLIEGTTTGLTGLDPEELARVRTQGRSMVAKLVPIITGDESGRYTDREQQRTEDIQAQSQFWKSSDQVYGGLTELQAITLRGEIRFRGEQAISDFVGNDIDITTSKGIDTWGKWLEKQGLSEEDVRRELKTHLALIGYSQ